MTEQYRDEAVGASLGDVLAKQSILHLGEQKLYPRAKSRAGTPVTECDKCRGALTEELIREEA